MDLTCRPDAELIEKRLQFKQQQSIEKADMCVNEEL